MITDKQISDILVDGEEFDYDTNPSTKEITQCVRISNDDWYNIFIERQSTMYIDSDDKMYLDLELGVYGGFYVYY